jgi:hypothetical protein
VRYGRGDGNTFSNGKGRGGDALGMGLCFLVFKAKSAAESFEGVIVSLSEKLEGLGQLSGFLLHFTHEGLGKFSVSLFQFVHDWFTSQV